MRKYSVLTIALALMVSSCNKEFDNAMKSTDKDVILKAANDFYAKKKWDTALQLYERLPNLVAGTPEAADVAFKQAYANYYDKNYKLAGMRFKTFAANNPSDQRREEAAYMSAICYYKGSYEYDLDQENTISAIDELQSFLDTYPGSDKTEDVKKKIDELTNRLEYKAYQNALQYYKMAQYLAADVTFENVLEDYPAIKYKPEIYGYMMRSKERLAVNSIFDKKADRLDNAIAFTRQVEREYPNSQNSKDAVQIRGDLEREKTNFDKLVAERDARMKELAARGKDTGSAQQAADAANVNSNQLERENAIMNTPKAGVKLNKGK